jgi:hypothetical protein
VTNPIRRVPPVEKIPDNPRLVRIRFLGRLLDESIVLPSGYRIGLDPLLGLIPGIGDAIGAVLSTYIIYEAACLGVRKRVLARMMGNVAVEGLLGSFPGLGDLFDAVWKANMRNLRLVELHYDPAKPCRSGRRVMMTLGIFLLALLVMIISVVVLVMQFFLSLLGF